MVKSIEAGSMPGVYRRYMIIDEETGKVLDDAQGIYVLRVSGVGPWMTYKEILPLLCSLIIEVY